MSDISTVTVNNETYNLKDTEARTQNALHHIYYVYGTQTAKTNAFTGDLPEVEALYQGLMIVYHQPFDGTSTAATLNLTLKDGTETGAIPMYWHSTTRLTTQSAAQWMSYFVYRTVTISGTSYTGWWRLTDKNDNTTDIVNLYQGTGTFVAHSALYRYQLLFQIDENTLTPLNNVNNTTGTTKAMLTSVEFDPFGYVFWYNSTTNIAANGAIGNSLYYHRQSFDLRYSLNIGSTLTANKMVYLVLTITNGKAKIVADPCWSQTLPASNDGKYYMLLGRAASTTNLTLYTDHPIYYHDGTSLRKLENIDLATETNPGLMSASDKAKLDGLDADDYAPASHTHDASDITSGTLPAARGGTGKTTLNDAGNAIINALGEGTSQANRNDYIVAQYANGGTTTTTYHRRKLSNIFAALNSSDVTTALGFTPSANNHTHGNITNAGAITSDTAVASGDKIVVADSSDSSKLIRTGISFDGSTTSKALTPKGTWESFASSSHVHNSIELTNQNLNNYYDDAPTWYFAGGSNSVTNKPSGVDAFGMVCFRSAQGYYHQILTKHDSTTYFSRTAIKSSSTWSAWTQWKLTDTTYTNGNGINLSGTTFSAAFPTSGTPAALGTASNGTSNNVARADHVHAKPTYSKSDVGLGNVTNDAQIAKAIGTAKGDIIYFSGSGAPERLAIGSNGQVLKVSSSGIPAWSSDTDTDTKVTNTLDTTTKYYVTGTTTATTNTGTQSFDSGIYATTTAGQLNATTYKVNEQVTLQWNATDESLDFVFA